MYKRSSRPKQTLLNLPTSQSPIMASKSSHNTHQYYVYPCHLEEEDEEDGDWLQLGLGLGNSTTKTTTITCRKQEYNFELQNNIGSGSAASSSCALAQFQAHQLNIGHSSSSSSSSGLELGLGLVGSDGRNGGVRDIDVATLGNYHKKSSCLWQDRNQYYQEDDHDYYNLDLTDARRSSSPSWPWPWHSSTYSFVDWVMPLPAVPNDFHNCSSPLPIPTTPLTITTTPHSSAAGLWFTLRSSINREGEGLPQIPKAYIRVKDENVITVFMVMKYLVTKLGLSNEAEIELSCTGQKLSYTQTLKQVRDTVWLPGLVESHSSSSSAISSENSLLNGSILHHLMPLQYARCSILAYGKQIA